MSKRLETLYEIPKEPWQKLSNAQIKKHLIDAQRFGNNTVICAGAGATWNRSLPNSITCNLDQKEFLIS